MSSLSLRSLNRALLARQMLLARERVSAVEAVERLAGMQAQQARPPFVGLWTRVADFDKVELQRALEERTVVRSTLMRATLHLASAPDYLAWRTPLQPMLSAAFRGILRQRADGVDLDALLVRARAHLAEQPLTFNALRNELSLAWPDLDERAMGYMVRLSLPLVMVPDESPWSFPADSRFALTESWLSQAPADGPGLDGLVRRYLAAFGPATVADVQAWSGAAGLKAVVEAMRRELVTFRDERNRELFDLPDAPRPSEDEEAPVRFLPEFDNILLAHADRRRIIADEHRPRVVTRNLLVLATFLVDGFVAGTWKIERRRKQATLSLTPFDPLAGPAESALRAEGERVLTFIEPDAEQYQILVMDPGTSS